MIQAMDQTISTAIREKKLLQFFYDGYVRVVEPHAYGVNKKRNDSLCAWQRSGKPLETPDWRFYTVSKMRQVQMLQESFGHAHLGYKRNDERMTTIYEQL